MELLGHKSGPIENLILQDQLCTISLFCVQIGGF